MGTWQPFLPKRGEKQRKQQAIKKKGSTLSRTRTSPALIGLDEDEGRGKRRGSPFY